MPQLTAGTHLQGAGDTAEVIVVRAPVEPIDLRYGGVPLLSKGSTPPSGAQGVADPSGPGILLGKRYVHEASGLELLCVKSGPGALAVGGTVLLPKSGKQLPASD